MRKSIEMRQELETMRGEINALQAAGKITEAHNKLDAFNKLKASIEVQEAIETEEDKNFHGTPANTGSTVSDKVMRNRVFNKLVLGRPMDDAEKAIAATMTAGTPGQVGATPAKGGYLLPEQEMNRLMEFRRGLLSLKPLCEIIPTVRRSGSFPTVTDDTGTLTNFDELNEITQGDIDFSHITFAIGAYGEIIPVANELLEDIDIDLIGVIGSRFQRKAVRTENAKIIAKLANLTPNAITNYKGIKKAINVTLDSTYADGANIVTNQDGFDWLDELDDSNGHPLLQPLLTDPTKKMLAGHIITVASNTQLPTATKVVPIYVGSMFDYVKFFDRKAVTVDVSREAGFTKNATFLRAIERFDVEAGDASAMVALSYTLA